MNEPSLNLLLLGDPGLDEFQPVAAFLRRHVFAASKTAVEFSELRQLVGHDGWYPDLVIVLQTWPDQFSEAEIHELITRCPLARIICCFGPWCDSDGRTRSIWPLAVRVPVAAARTRIAKEVALLRNPLSASRPLPLTASRGEIFDFDFGRTASAALPSITAVVISPDRRWRGMLQTAIETRGCRIAAAGTAGPPEVVLYDADPWDPRQEAALRSTREAHPQATLVACAGFPRFDLDASLRRAGADRVWFKLAPLDELVAGVTV